jgi:predicted HTH domain antitoxin
MELILELPDTLLIHYKDKHFFSKAFKLNNALMLYKRGDISIGRASELANIDIYDFIKECNNNDIPVINYSKEELLRDIDDTCSR